MFRYTMTAGGISQDKFVKQEITPGVRVPIPVGFLINDWTFANGTAGGPDYTHLNDLQVAPAAGTGFGLGAFTEKVNGVWRYKWGQKVEVSDAQGIPGQNEANPLSMFARHYVVRYGDTLYDPSYGRVYAAPTIPSVPAWDWDQARGAWERASLAGVYGLIEYVDNAGVKRDRLGVYKPAFFNTLTIFTSKPWL